MDTGRTPLRNPNGPGKRKRRQNGDSMDDYFSDGPGDTEREDASNRKGKAIELPKFACPYFKYNPAKYKSWGLCPGPGWSDIHRVK